MRFIPLFVTTIKTRIALSFGLLVLLAAAQGVYGLYYMDVLNKRIDHMYTEELLTIKRLGEIKSTVDAMQIVARDHVQLRTATTGEILNARIQEGRKQVRKLLATYKIAPLTRVEKKLTNAFEAHFTRFAGQLQDEILSLDSSGKVAVLSAEESNKTTESLGELVDYNANSAQTSYQYAIADYSTNFYVILGIILATFSLSVFVGVFVTRSVTHPINTAVTVARRIASGDLTGELSVTSQDEMGRLLLALEEMTRNLRQIVNRVRTSADTISLATQEIATGNIDLSQRTEQQAAALEQTVASLDQITATARENAKSSQDATAIAAKASESAQQGATAMELVVKSMSSINNSAQKIGDIIGMIDSIAFQTNILALNAAIEAAHAGEHGRGFSVVANEVRSLAQKSTALSREIKGHIEKSLLEVSHGTDCVADARSTIQKIVANVENVQALIAEIASASNEQRGNVEQIQKVIEHIDGDTQKNAALVEESTAAGISLHQQAEDLARSVRAFKISETPNKMEVVQKENRSGFLIREMTHVL